MKNSITKRMISGDFDRLFDTIRWNSSIYAHQRENLASHQYMVGVLANALSIDLSFAPEYRLQVLQYALHHDWDEIFTGDIGHEVKYNKQNGPKIREILDQLIEYTANVQFIENATDESEVAIGLVLNGGHGYEPCVPMLSKVCDWLSMLFFCVRETRLGNKRFEQKLVYCVNSTLASIDRFWEQFKIDISLNDKLITVLEPEESIIQELIVIVREALQSNVQVVELKQI